MEFALYMLVILLFCVIAVGAFFHNTIVAGLKDELLTAETRLRAAFMSRSKVAQFVNDDQEIKKEHHLDGDTDDF